MTKILDQKCESLWIVSLCPHTVILLMDLYEIRGGTLDVIAEEAEHQELSRASNTMESYTVGSNRGGRATRDVSTFQRFSVDTNESLRFEPCEDASPSPTGAEDGYDDDDDDDDDVFQEGEIEVGTLTQLWPIMYEENISYFLNLFDLWDFKFIC